MDPRPPSASVRIAWTIAGSDSGGGAGIQADLRTFGALGVHGCSVVTAVTAQNTRGVQALEAVSPTLLEAQFQALEADLPPAAIKTGMLGSAQTCQIVAEALERLPETPVVCDPVLASTSGTDLLDPAALDILVRAIFPKVDILTPNLPETEKLLGHPVQSVEAAAEELLARGAGSVLVKGGHACGDACRDYWTDGTRALWLSSPRVATRATHGTGCILSAALAAALARGQAPPQAVASAKHFLNQCLNAPAGVGAGHGPMRIEPFRNERRDQPQIEEIA